MRKLTFEEEITAISKAFKVSPQKIKEIINPKKPKKNKASTSRPKINQEKSDNPSKNKADFFSFNSFEDEYILSKNEKEELKVIEKYIPVCTNIKDIKLLYNLCPPTNKELRDKILLFWVNLVNNLEEIRELRALTTKGTRAADIAYEKFIKFFK